MDDLMNKINLPLCLGILAGILAIIGAFSQWREKKDASIKSKVAQDSLKNLQEKILINTEALSEAYKENARLQAVLNSKSDHILGSTNELKDLYKENAVLQEELKNQITGGENKPVLLIRTHPGSDPPLGQYYVTNFDIGNNGKYPLHNLRVTVMDFYGPAFERVVKVKRDRMGNETVITKPDDVPVLYSNNKEFDLGTLNTGQQYPVYSSVYQYLGNEFYPFYTVVISWNNGNAAGAITNFFSTFDCIDTNIDWHSINTTDFRDENADGDEDRIRKKHAELLVRRHVPPG